MDRTTVLIPVIIELVNISVKCGIQKGPPMHSCPISIARWKMQTVTSYEHTAHQIWHFTNTEPIIFTQCNEGIQNYNSQWQEIKNPYMQDLFPREKVTWVFTALLYQYFRRKIKRPIKTLQTDPLLSTEQNLSLFPYKFHGFKPYKTPWNRTYKLHTKINFETLIIFFVSK